MKVEAFSVPASQALEQSIKAQFVGVVEHQVFLDNRSDPSFIVTKPDGTFVPWPVRFCRKIVEPSKNNKV